MYERILVATDGSALSDKAVRGAIDLASTVGAEIVALHVVPRFSLGYFDGDLAISPDDVAKIEKKHTAQGQDMVDAVKAAAKAKGVKAKALVVRSDVVSDALIKTAKQQKCDLIVMASHGRKGIKRVLLGSETQQVLTRSPIPTLVLR